MTQKSGEKKIQLEAQLQNISVPLAQAQLEEAISLCENTRKEKKLKAATLLRVDADRVMSRFLSRERNMEPAHEEINIKYRTGEKNRVWFRGNKTLETACQDYARA